MTVLIIRFYFFLAMLLTSAGIAFATDCASDPNECTPKGLCQVATELIEDNLLWSTAITSNKHVSFAQELGMNCGVVELKDPCDTDPNECKIKQLCEKATTEDNGTKSWNSEAEAYVVLAKEYGLKCDVVGELKAEADKCKAGNTKSANCRSSTVVPSVKENSVSGNCGSNPEACKNYQVCMYATIKKNNHQKWNEAFTEHVSEAKKRGLDCGIELDKPSELFYNWTDEAICKYANEPGNDMLFKEAKVRGLTCGTAEVKSSVTKILQDIGLDPASQFMTPLKCEDEAGLKSKKSTTKIKMLFKNDTMETLNLFWLDWVSKRKKYFSNIKPGRNRSIITYEGHVWVATTLKNKCVSIAVPVMDTTSKKATYVLSNRKISGLDYCGSNPEACKNYQVCMYATIKKNNHQKWNEAFTEHVSEAKKRGLTCGTAEVKSSVREEFLQLSERERKQIQSNLKGLGFYNLSIDGLYGKGTAAAISKYNNKKLNGKNLGRSDVVVNVLNAILELEPPSSSSKKTTTNQENGNVLKNSSLECPKSGTRHNCFGFGTTAGGGKYEGNWKNGKQHGEGTTLFPNGNKHFGKYQDGFRDGQGTFIFKNEGKYVGEFKGGQMHGQGIYTWENGDEFVGVFKNGNPQKGKLDYADEIWKDEIWKDGKSIDRSRFFDTNNICDKPEWKRSSRSMRELLCIQEAEEIYDNNGPCKTVAAITKELVGVPKNYNFRDGMNAPHSKMDVINRARNQLGVLYALGCGVPKDTKKALKLFNLVLEDWGHAKSYSIENAKYFIDMFAIKTPAQKKLENETKATKQLQQHYQNYRFIKLCKEVNIITSAEYKNAQKAIKTIENDEVSKSPNLDTNKVWEQSINSETNDQKNLADNVKTLYNMGSNLNQSEFSTVCRLTYTSLIATASNLTPNTPAKKDF